MVGSFASLPDIRQEMKRTGSPYGRGEKVIGMTISVVSTYTLVLILVTYPEFFI